MKVPKSGLCAPHYRWFCLALGDFRVSCRHTGTGCRSRVAGRCRTGLPAVAGQRSLPDCAAHRVPHQAGICRVVDIGLDTEGIIHARTTAVPAHFGTDLRLE